MSRSASSTSATSRRTATTRARHSTGFVAKAQRGRKRGSTSAASASSCGGPDLLEALCVARGLEDIGDPAVALPAGPGERGVRAPADPDGRERLDGLRVDRDRLEPGEPALERRGRVAPERPHDVDALADA